MRLGHHAQRIGLVLLGLGLPHVPHQGVRRVVEQAPGARRLDGLGFPGHVLRLFEPAGRERVAPVPDQRLGVEDPLGGHHLGVSLAGRGGTFLRDVGEHQIGEVVPHLVVRRHGLGLLAERLGLRVVPLVVGRAGLDHHAAGRFGLRRAGSRHFLIDQQTAVRQRFRGDGCHPRQEHQAVRQPLPTPNFRLEHPRPPFTNHAIPLRKLPGASPETQAGDIIHPRTGPFASAPAKTRSTGTPRGCNSDISRGQ